MHLFKRFDVHISENTLLLALAVIVGLGSGLCIWVFREAIDLFEHARLNMADALPFGEWSIVLVLGFAGLVVGLLMWLFVGEERHHGVAGIIESVALYGGRLPYRKAPFKALAASLSIGMGASVGPEDPSVQIGSNLGSFMGRLLRLTEERVQLLVAAGSASAIAAAFNAPIAGVFFALEVVLSDFTTGSVGVVVLAAVMSAVFTQSVEHSEPELGIRSYELGGPEQIPFYILLGLLASPIAAAFIRNVYWQSDLWHQLKVPTPLKTALAGVMVGIVAVYFPEIMGTGRETMNEVLNTGSGNFTVQLLLALVIVKLVMTSVSMAGGFVGGIFAPSLFVGAMLGGAYGRILERAFPRLDLGDPAAYAIAGMGAMMAGIVRAPITAILLIFELTNNYQLILPIMLTTVVCVFLAELMEKDGIYTLGLRRKGVHIQQGRDVDVMQSVRVEEVMRVPAPTLPMTASLKELRDAFRQHSVKGICVVDETGDLYGIVTLTDLQTAYDAAQQANMPMPLTVADICTREVLTITPHEAVWKAIRRMGQLTVGSLPVVMEDNPRQVVGLLRRSDVMRSYNLAIARKWESQYVQQQIRLNNLVDRHSVEVRIPAHSGLVGREVREVRWPEASLVASIRRGAKVIFPHGSTRLEVHDVLTVVIDPHQEAQLHTLLEQPAVAE